MFTSPTGTVIVAGADRFFDMRTDLLTYLLAAPVVHGRRWQQLDVSQSDAHATHELLNVTLWYDMPQVMADAVRWMEPDMPWAEAHFLERVGGEPVNPGVQHELWPYHAGRVDLHQHGGRYDHNYMERFWAGLLTDRDWCDRQEVRYSHEFHGYRFEVGDLGDVVAQLRADPTTRQAYLPVWFPEDTGATSGQRVPCTLGYHFIIRDGALHVQYNIRSCDAYRHFTNDAYMAVRLAQWVADQLDDDEPGGEWGDQDDHLRMGQLTMHAVSMHGFVGDVPKLREMRRGW